MKVSFLIAGVQKSGTTSLNAWLRQHPAIGMARHKEVHFFDDETAHTADPPSYGAYHAMFDAAPGYRLPRAPACRSPTPGWIRRIACSLRTIA
jgi:hypothetical protein